VPEAASGLVGPPTGFGQDAWRGQERVLLAGVVDLALQSCGVPVAWVAVTQAGRQLVQGHAGMSPELLTQAGDLLDWLQANDAPSLEIADTLQHPTFASHPMVVGAPQWRYFAGAALRDEQGQAWGAVAVADHQPRHLQLAQRQALAHLAQQAALILKWKRMADERNSFLRQELQRGQHLLFEATAAAVQSLDMCAFIDGEFVLRYANTACLSGFGCSVAQVLDKPFARLCGEEVFDTHLRPLIERALAGERVEAALQAPWPHLGWRCLQLSCVPAAAPSAGVTGVVLRAQDIHEHERERRELLQANEQLEARLAAMQRFTNTVSMDLYQPVQEVGDSAHVLQTRLRGGLDGEQLDCVRKLSIGAARLKGTLNDLMDYARLEAAGDRPMEEAVVDLAEVMEQVEADLANMVDTTHARLHRGPLPKVLGDRGMLRLLMRNLVSNALKFHRPDRPAQVQWGARARKLGYEVFVRDRGIGMDTQMQGQLFEPFIKRPGTEGSDGSGLGLAICRRIVQLHGGQMSVASQPGLGSTFTVWLKGAPVDRAASDFGPLNEADLIGEATQPAGLWPADTLSGELRRAAPPNAMPLRMSRSSDPRASLAVPINRP
jgi:PAS domain S-box-containing protein